MEDDKQPTGARYSQIYLRTDELCKEAPPRIRRRVYHYVGRQVHDRFLWELGIFLESELGVKLEFGDYDGFDWEDYWRTSELKDFLDSITLCIKFVALELSGDKSKTLIDQIDRAFREEQLAYTLDGKGGVHPFVDTEFKRNLTTSIRTLAGDRYEAARNDIRLAEEGFLSDPPDGRQAIRSVFDAAENIFKQMFEKENKLVSSALERLMPIAQRRYNGDNHAISVAAKEIGSFKQWVDAAHNYRHQHGKSEIAELPDDLMILMVSQGLSFVRWIASLDAWEQARLARAEEAASQDRP